MTIKAVTFDLWATLLSNPAAGGKDRHRVRVNALRETLTERGDAVTSDEIHRMMMAEWKTYNARWYGEQRTPLNHERVAWMVRELGLEPLDRDATEAVANAFDESIWAGPPSIVDGALEVVRELAGRGIALGVISDTAFTTGKTMRALLDRYALLEPFESAALCFSDEVGVAKPNGLIFERARAALGVDANAIAHVGDNPKTDIRGANDAGFASVLYKPDASAIADDASARITIATFAELVPALPFD